MCLRTKAKVLVKSSRAVDFTAPVIEDRSSRPAIEADDLRFFCNMISDRAGIYLKPSKHELVRTRLRSRISELGMTYGEYRDHLGALAKNDPEWETFTNLLTTNKTDFFREPKHFDFLTQQILPAWSRTKQKTFNVWSAASSTGEEAYTLAMLLQRHLPAGHDFKILATDIDTEVILSGRNAVYSMAKAPEIPEEYHASCIEYGKREARGYFRIKRQLKDRVTFQAHNLIAKGTPGEAVFDLVLCRNVLIYFAPENIDFVQRKLYTTIRPGGHLFIGHSESLQGLNHQWTSAGPSVFKKGS